MASVDGLISGMSTTDTITQLMKLEALPQSALKTKVATQNKVVTAYQSVNTRFSSLLSAARALGNADTWGAMKATSSSEAALVTTSAGAPAGSLSFTVDKLASAHTVTLKDGFVAATTSPVTSGNTLHVLKTDGTTHELTLTDKSLSAVAAAINGVSGAAYTANTVQLGPDKYTLQFTAKTTGATAAFTGGPAGVDARGVPTGIDLLGPASTITTQGVDARLTVGKDATYTVTSATNTFTGVLPGVTVTATKTQTDTPVTVSLVPDKDGIAAKVQALVDSANTALNEIASQSKVKNGEVAAGPLAGDAALRALSQEILSAVSTGAGGLGSLSAVGITVGKDYKLAFDKQKFQDALTADPVKTRSYFDSYTDRSGGTAAKFQPGWDTASGIARKMETIAATASEGVVLPTDPTSKAKEGTITGLIKRKNEYISGLNKQVESWDSRLELRRSTLERQFSNLEVALGKLQQQSSWLAGQIAGLPTYS